jgi:hypothetical protein
MEFDSKELNQNAKVIRYAEYQKTPELELDYLLKELFKIASNIKPFKLYRPTYDTDGSKHRGSNNLKKAIIYNTYEDESIFELDYWKVQLAKDILFRGIPITPPEKMYSNLETQQKQDLRNFYACFGWQRKEVKVGTVYKKLWKNDYMILSSKSLNNQSDKN